MTVEPNTPLPIQPIVRLTDSQSKPIQGRRVVAFNWIDPTFLESVVNFKNSPSHLKFLTLENFISEPSDENGIAKFTSLKVTGSNDIMGYIHFYAEGVSTPWTDRPIGQGFEEILPPRAVYPFYSSLNNVEIEIENDHPREEKEGQVLGAPYSLIVKDPDTLEPVPNRLCFVNIQKSRNDIIPLGYQSWYDRHPVKHIERPIPANYTEGVENPEYPGEVISKYYLTDQEGKVSFDDLRISQTGPIGNFTLGFSCGGALRQVSQHEIAVWSSIDPDTISFTQVLPETVYVNDLGNQEFDMVVNIEVLDSEQNGVPGKYPEIISITAEDPGDQKYIEIAFANEIELFQASGKDGVITIPIKITKLIQNTVANITLDIDGIEITTKFINFQRLPNLQEKIISAITIVDFPKDKFEKGLEIGDTFEINAQATDLNGDTINYEDYKFELKVFFNPVTQAPARKNFIVLEGDEPSERRGKLKFSSYKFTRATDGHFYLRVYAYAKNNPSVLLIASNLIRVLMKNPIDGAIVTGVAPKTSTNLFYNPAKLNFLKLSEVEGEYFEAQLDQTYIFEILVFNFIDGPIINKKVPPPPFDFEEYPPIMHGLNKGPYEFFTIRNLQSSTNESGFYFVEIRLHYGGVGAYVTSFDFGTGISIPMAFMTNNPVIDISISSEPFITNIPPDDPELNAFYTGRIFNIYARVKIEVSIGPKDGYLVIAQPISEDGNDSTVEILPQSKYSLDDKIENYLAWVTAIEGVRIARTDRNGEAKFDSLSVWDISGENTTVKFCFGVGDRHENMYMVSAPTNSNYTFIPSNSFEIIQQPSRNIASFIPIVPVPTIKMTSQILNFVNIISVQLNELFSGSISDSYDLLITKRYLTGVLCLGIFTNKIEATDG